MNADEKYQKMKESLRLPKKVAVAFSGGVDSSFLLAAAAETLGAGNVLACIGISPSLPEHQLRQGRQIADLLGVRLIEAALHEIKDPNYQANKADRCFHCKTHQFKTILETAAAEGIEHVLCGSNFDDQDDFRPGRRAVEALGIGTPLADAELTKEDIRELSRRMNLPTSELPASPCLASRVAYGEPITIEKLGQVEKAEDFLRALGFVQFRVRHHGRIARIEVPSEQIEKITESQNRSKIIDFFKKIGFQYITLDLEGFRSGSLNESLTDAERRQTS